MSKIERIKNIDFSPISVTKGISKEELNNLLFNKNNQNQIFCWHKWIYWKFGKASKLHRICKKCGKKQQNVDIFNHYNIWIKEQHIFLDKNKNKN